MVLPAGKRRIPFLTLHRVPSLLILPFQDLHYVLYLLLRLLRVQIFPGVEHKAIIGKLTPEVYLLCNNVIRLFPGTLVGIRSGLLNRQAQVKVHL